MSKFTGLGLAVETPSRLVLEHPVTGQPLRNAETGEEAWIELLSGSGSVARAHDRAMTDKMLKRNGRRLSAEEFEADQTERLAKLTRGWSLVTLDGQPLDVKFDQAAARELYSLPELAWVREQVQRHIADIGNFPQTGSTS